MDKGKLPVLTKPVRDLRLQVLWGLRPPLAQQGSPLEKSKFTKDERKALQPRKGKLHNCRSGSQGKGSALWGRRGHRLHVFVQWHNRVVQ